MYKCDGIHIVCIYVYMHTCIHARMQENTVENNKFQIQKRLSWDALRQVHGAGSTSVVLLLQIGTWDGMFPNKVELKIESNKYVFCGGGAIFFWYQYEPMHLHQRRDLHVFWIPKAMLWPLFPSPSPFPLLWPLGPADFARWGSAQHQRHLRLKTQKRFEKCMSWFVVYIITTREIGCLFVDTFWGYHLQQKIELPPWTCCSKCCMFTAPGVAVLGKLKPEVKALIASGVVCTSAWALKVKRSRDLRVRVSSTLIHHLASSRISGWSRSKTGCWVVVTAKIFFLSWSDMIVLYRAIM